MVTSMKRLISNLKLSKDKETLPSKIKPYFLATLAELMEEGFSLNQSLAFTKLLLLKHQEKIQKMDDQLQRGDSIEKSLQPLGYSIAIVAQLFYAQRQGRFVESLKEAADQLNQSLAYRKQMVKSLAYPVVMAVFLLILLFGMREFMLPHITSFISEETYESHFLVRLLLGFFTYLPQLSVAGFALGLLVYLGIDFYLMRLPELERYQRLVKLPIASVWVKTYCTHRLARELGYFFQGGYSIQQTLDTILKYPIDPFLCAVAEEIRSNLVQGEPLVDILASLEIFTVEFPLVIQQGELTSQTAQKCLLYSNKMQENLIESIAKVIGLLQPILFILIAVLVMGMYLLMLLPMLTMEI